MRSAVAHGHTESLAVAHHHIRPHGTGALDEGTGQQVRGHDHANVSGMGLGNGLGQRFHTAPVIRVLDHHAERARIQIQIVVRPLLDVDAQVGGAGTQDRPGLREDPVGHDETVHPFLGRLAAPGIEQHRHRFRRGRGLIQQAGVGQLHAGEVAHHGLEVHQRLESSLGNLRLVGGVGGVPTRILQHIAADHTRHFGRVVPETNVVAVQGVLGGNPIHVLEVGTLGHRLWNRHRSITEDGLRNRSGNQRGHGVMTCGGQHVLLFLIAGAEVALDERCGCHGAEQIKVQK